jgi:hypothetical protein
MRNTTGPSPWLCLSTIAPRCGSLHQHSRSPPGGALGVHNGAGRYILTFTALPLMYIQFKQPLKNLKPSWHLICSSNAKDSARYWSKWNYLKQLILGQIISNQCQGRWVKFTSSKPCNSLLLIHEVHISGIDETAVPKFSYVSNYLLTSIDVCILVISLM